MRHEVRRGASDLRTFVSARRAPEAKRVLDVAVAATALALLTPLILVVALAVKLESRGPAFFRCRRVGVDGRTLWMLKFRKMRDGVGGPPLTAARDDRFTRIGHVLAKTKLDELPQLWNVLRGEMSLVGPRPEDPSIVDQQRAEYMDILRPLAAGVRKRSRDPCIRRPPRRLREADPSPEDAPRSSLRRAALAEDGPADSRLDRRDRHPPQGGGCASRDWKADAAAVTHGRHGGCIGELEPGHLRR